MATEKSGKTDQRNEGEGNRTAAREYNKAQQEFVRSGAVKEKAREAEEAIEGEEDKTLERAEEDPEVKR